jgi:DNA-binding transcriptional LysR family regulator
VAFWTRSNAVQATTDASRGIVRANYKCDSFVLRTAAAADTELSIQRVADILRVAIGSTWDDIRDDFIDEALNQRGLARKVRKRAPFNSIVLMLVGSNRPAVAPGCLANDLARMCPRVVKELPSPTPRTALSMNWHRRLDNHQARRWPRDIVSALAQT